MNKRRQRLLERFTNAVQMGHLLCPLLIFDISRAEHKKAITNNLHQFMRCLVFTSKKRHVALVQLTSFLDITRAVQKNIRSTFTVLKCNYKWLITSYSGKHTFNNYARKIQCKWRCTIHAQREKVHSSMHPTTDTKFMSMSAWLFSQSYFKKSKQQEL